MVHLPHFRYLTRVGGMVHLPQFRYLTRAGGMVHLPHFRYLTRAGGMGLRLAPPEKRAAHGLRLFLGHSWPLALQANQAAWSKGIASS
jgi:hypothetical protein